MRLVVEVVRRIEVEVAFEFPVVRYVVVCKRLVDERDGAVISIPEDVVRTFPVEVPSDDFLLVVTVVRFPTAVDEAVVFVYSVSEEVTVVVILPSEVVAAEVVTGKLLLAEVVVASVVM